MNTPDLAGAPEWAEMLSEIHCVHMLAIEMTVTEDPMTVIQTRLQEHVTALYDQLAALRLNASEYADAGEEVAR